MGAQHSLIEIISRAQRLEQPGDPFCERIRHCRGLLAASASQGAAFWRVSKNICPMNRCGHRLVLCNPACAWRQRGKGSFAKVLNAVASASFRWTNHKD